MFRLRPSVQLLLARIFSSRGRLALRPYLFTLGFTLLGFLGVTVISSFVAAHLGTHVSGSSGLLWSLMLAGLLILVLVPSVNAGIQRLHDAGRSGWWMLLLLIPLLGGGALLALHLQPSQQGENHWGTGKQGSVA